MSDNTHLDYMCDSEIVDFIENYIDKSSYNYAILIDGSWGSGKTFFLEKTLIPSIRDSKKSNKNGERKIINISLYGITTKDELTRQIWIETVAFSKLLKSKPFKIGSSIGKVILGGALSYKGISLPEFTINEDVLMSLKNCILIFDDLERCSMDINDILGYINNFVEHDGIKVIIVANEKEIATTRLISNKELKYLTALSHDIEFSESKNNNKSNLSTSANQQENDVHSRINISELPERVRLLFGEDDIYKQIKEKLIGVTIHYKPNISEIIDKIVQNNIDDEQIRKIIIENKNFIMQKLNSYMHYNIRTILFCFDKFNTLAKIIIDGIGFKDSENVLNDIFKYIVIISIRYKMGKPLPNWEKNSEIEQLCVSGDLFNLDDYIKGFRFVDDFISKTKLNNTRVISVIKRHLEILKSQVKDPNDPLYKLINDWFQIDEDSEISDLLTSINTSLKENPKKYDISNYGYILYLNIFFNSIGVVSIDIQRILEIMKNNMRFFDVKIEFNIFGWTGFSFGDDDDKKLYRECIESLNAQHEKYNNENDIKNLNSIFDNISSWTDELSKYVSENQSKLLNQKAFISKMDFNKLLNTIKLSSSIHIVSFRSIIVNAVYNLTNINVFYHSDKDVIDKLSLELEEYVNDIKETQKNRTYNIRYLIKALNNISERL